MSGTKSEKLDLWQRRLAESNAAFGSEVAKMDERERIYNGDNTLRSLVPGDRKRDGSAKKTSHVRNIVFENIESEVSSSIPQPKVTPRRKQDEHLAEVIEHFLRNELDRLPFEAMNDMAERTVPIQGGVGFLVEWDNAKRTHNTVGEVRVSLVHPKQFAPQPGVYTGIEDMDWFIVKVPTTKSEIRRQFGVNLDLEGEAEPDIRGTGGEDASADAVTRYVGYARNDKGGLDRYSWVNDTELEDLENYQARHLPVCESCGTVRPPEGGACPTCGGTRFVSRAQETQAVVSPISAAAGGFLPGSSPLMQPARLPFYRPDRYPIILQRSVSVYGSLLGNSDVDVIRDQQNTINRIEQKIIDRLVKAGTRVTLPDRADLRMDPEDAERWYIGNPADKSMIGLYEFSGNLQYELLYLSNVYEEARQILGITDSFQGRKDATATSGKAKEFSAAQAAGRLESKRIMKDAAYASLFELMFKFWLAYSDEPRTVSFKNFRGEVQYEAFNRYDFLEQDAAGNYFWNDQFLFSCDSTAPLASNREAMWQETRQNLQTGAFGDPSKMETLILFWEKMEELHYPGAGTTKVYLEDMLQQQQAQAMMAQQAAQLQAQQPVPPELADAVQEQARRDALRDVQRQAGYAAENAAPVVSVRSG